MNDAWPRTGWSSSTAWRSIRTNIWTKFPVAKLEDLQGKKLSAPGPSATGQGHRRVAVAGSLNTYYETSSSGVSDGALVFATGAAGAKLHEVAPYITKVNFGAMFAGGLVINKSVFDKLRRGGQKALREAADVWAQEYVKRQGRGGGHVLQNMTAAGAKISELSPAERKRWADALGPVAKTWAADVNGKGGPGGPGAEGVHRGAEEGRHNVAARLVQLTWHPPQRLRRFPPGGRRQRPGGAVPRRPVDGAGRRFAGLVA